MFEQTKKKNETLKKTKREMRKTNANAYKLFKSKFYTNKHTK